MSTSNSALSAQEHAATFTKRKRAIALTIVALAFVMDLLDSTVVNVAIPSIRTSLSAGYSAIQWVVAGYSLTFAVLLVIGGRMGDVFGYKRLFMLGVSGFTLASLLSGVSTGPTMLIAARILQGSMAALMVPQVMSLMQVMYKPEERSVINGLFGTLGGLAASLGPVLSGLLLKANVFSLGWRPIFLINVPVGVFGLLAAIKYLPGGKSTHPLKLDLLGTAAVTTAIFLLVFPLIQGRDLGWPAWSFLMMAASVPMFGLFVWWQRVKARRDGSPLILLSLFRNKSFSVGLAANLIFYMAIIGFFLTITLLLQIGHGFSPIHSALTNLPIAFGIAITMTILGKNVIPKLGRYSISIGAVVMSLGFGTLLVVLRHYGSAVHSWQLIPSQLLTGIGMGFVFGALVAAVLNGVDPQHAGSASGTMNAIQQIGAAVGVAIIGVIFFGQLNQAAPASFNTAKPQLHTTLAALHIPAQTQAAVTNDVERCFVDRSREKDSSVVPPACKQTGQNSSVVNKELARASASTAAQANADNFNNAFSWSVWYMIGLLAVSFGLSFALPAHFKADAYKEA